MSGVRDDLASSLFSCVRLSKDSSLVEPVSCTWWPLVALVATARPRMDKRLGVGCVVVFTCSRSSER